MPVGLDALLLLLLVVARMPWLASSLGWTAAPALAVAAMLYLAAGVVLGARATRIKLVLLSLIAAAYVLAPTQTEAAARFLMDGKNPYSADYSQTALYNWDPQNPALHYYVNLPLQVLIALPAAFVSGDLRVIYSVLFVIVWILLWYLGRDPTSRFLLMMVFALNPLFSQSQAEGRNDIVVIAAFTAALVCMTRGRPRAAALLVGLACASKHTAWLFVPLYLAWSELSLGRAIRRAWPAWAAAGALFLPFVAWAPIAFWRSVWGYPSGTVPGSYPIRGDGAYGFATWVLAWRWVESDQAYFPFVLFQLLLGVPVLVLCVRWIRRERSLRSLLLGYALTLFSFQFFTRYFNQNHFAFVVLVAALGLLVREPDPDERAKMIPA